MTDVHDLFEWMTKHLTEHPLFQRIEDAEMKEDPVVEKLFESSEEGQKVTRNEGEKWCAVFRRIPDPNLWFQYFLYFQIKDQDGEDRFTD